MPRVPETGRRQPVTHDPEGLRALNRTPDHSAESNRPDSFIDGVERPRRTNLEAAGTSVGASLNQAPGLLNGSVELPAAGATHPSVRVIQAGLTALAERSGHTELHPGGTDGHWGRKTQNAVKAFQEQQGMAATGVVDRTTARALHQSLLAGGTSALDLRLNPLESVVTQPRAVTPSGDSMVEASTMLVEKYGNNYGVPDPWYNLDPNHALPANVSLGGLKGKWKCNLFGGNAMYAAGFEPPYYGNRGSGEYPNANQFFKWSDQYAAKYGNKVHFDLVGEVQVKGLDDEAKKTQIDAVLAQAMPGDMILVDHLGDDVADGGHTRVVISNDWAESGTLTAAQASRGDAQIKTHNLYHFTGEETLWILRPNKPLDDD